MDITHGALEDTIGQSLKALRIQRSMTIDQLSSLSGVSRAMISKIERAEASPTAVLLARLLTPLGQSLSEFFARPAPQASALQKREDQALWRDPETGYRRRAVSPPGFPMHTDLVEVELPAGARVTMPPVPSLPPQMQYVWLLEGELSMHCDGASHAMQAGDCLYMTLSHPITFHNPTTDACRYAVVLRRA